MYVNIYKAKQVSFVIIMSIIVEVDEHAYYEPGVLLALSHAFLKAGRFLAQSNLLRIRDLRGSQTRLWRVSLIDSVLSFSAGVSSVVEKHHTSLQGMPAFWSDNEIK